MMRQIITSICCTDNITHAYATIDSMTNHSTRTNSCASTRTASCENC